MKISVHRALAELKLLDSKIDRGTYKNFVLSKLSSSDKIAGVPIQTVVERIKSNYTSVSDLIDRRAKIKSAIIKSNALTEVKIKDRVLTVAEAIDEKISISYKINLLNELKKQHKQCSALVSQHNEKAQQNAENFVNGLYTDKTQVDINKIKALKEDHIKNNEAELVDPLDISKIIQELETYIEDFKSEVDYVLSESNATTFIEV